MANAELFPLPNTEEDALCLVGQGIDPGWPIPHHPPLWDPLDLVGDIDLFPLENALVHQNTSDPLLRQYDADTLAMNLAGSACLKPLTVKEYQELADFSSYSTSGVMATSDSLISDTSSQWGRPVTLPQQRRDPASDSTALNATWNNDSPERHGHSWQHKQAGRRKSHNIVERKYRINLNSKFRQLRDRVLEATQPSPSPTGGIPPTRRDGVEAKKLRGASSPNTTLSKADTLDIAIKYIMSMEDEIFLLKERLRMVETSSGGSL